jgi:hypothetical protein
MAFGQVDPARLEGEALRRWYLRSPDDTEDERKRAATMAYDNFFSHPRAGRTSHAAAKADEQGDRPYEVDWNTAGPNRWRGMAAKSNTAPKAQRHSVHDGQVQLAAAAPRGFWDYWGFRGCQNCHGYTPGTLPPIGGHSPYPPGYSPRSGNPGGSSSQPRKDKHPQCEMQERQDRGVCAQQPTERTKAVCNETATERRVWCDSHDGEIGKPRLFTARRKSDRPWP